MLSSETVREIQRVIKSRVQGLEYGFFVERSRQRILDMNPRLNAVIDLYSPRPMGDAESKDLPLAGVPFAIKDNMGLAGELCSAGSQMLKSYRSPLTATVVDRLLCAGAVPLARCNMDEFAMGSSNETSAFGPVKNPLSLEHSPGGSSGGSAAAVASGMVPFALGTDTGGSIRLPASHCGVVGLKPTYGKLSRYGIVAYGSSLDQPGPIARTVEDVELLFSLMAGEDPKDSTCSGGKDQLPVPGRMRIGVFPDLMANVSADVNSAFEAAAQILRDEGHEVVELTSPLRPEEIVATYYVIATSEASSNLSRYDGLRYGGEGGPVEGSLEDQYLRVREACFGFEVKTRILMGTFCLSSGHYNDWFLRAARVRALLLENLRHASKKVDAFLLPVSSEPPPRLGGLAQDPMKMYSQDSFTSIANLAGLPALAVPCLTTDAHLPVGVQFMAPADGESRCFALGKLIEKSRKGAS